MQEKYFKDKNLLILTQQYPDEKNKVTGDPFVKSQVDELKKYFKNIYVISQTPYFPRLISKIHYFPKYMRDYGLTQDYSYDNVTVYYPRYFTFPEGVFSKFRGDACYRSILNCIIRNNLKFDLIHAHFIWPNGYVAVRLKNRFNKKIVVTGHGFDVYELPFRNLFWQKMIRNILGNTDLIVTVSDFNARKIEELGIKEVIVLPNGYDSSKFFFMSEKDILKSKMQIPLDKKILLHVGNMVKVKNHVNLIKSMNELVKVRQDVILYLIGDGIEKQHIIDLIKEYHLEDYIILLGVKPHTEIPLWMNIADLFVLPSYSEGFGLVTIESLACGTPVISTINGGSEEIIVSKLYGLLLDNPNDYISLGKLINEGLEVQWDKKSITEYSIKYEWSVQVQRILVEYYKLL